MQGLGKKGNNLRNCGIAEFSDLHWVGREIIDEESLNSTWGLGLEAEASHRYSMVNLQRNKYLVVSRARNKAYRFLRESGWCIG